MSMLRSLALLALLGLPAGNSVFGASSNLREDRFAELGSEVELRSPASSDPAAAYQWRLNGDAIPGATGSVLRLSSLKAADGGVFSVVIYNDSGVLETREFHLDVNAAALPFADDFASRAALNTASGSGAGVTTAASSDPKDPRIADRKANKTLWISWVAPASGEATFTTDGSNFDTLLGVFKYNGKQFTEEASDDDAGGYATSSVTFNAQAGTRYEIAIGGAGQASGKAVLNWELKEKEQPYLQIFRQPKSQTLAPGQTLNLSVSYLGQPASASVLGGLGLDTILRNLGQKLGIVSVQWFRNEQPLSGQNSSDLRISNFQAEMAGLYSARLSVLGQTVWSLPADIQVSAEGLTSIGARNKLADAKEVGLKAASRQSLETLLSQRPQLNRAGIKHSGSISGSSGSLYYNSFAGHDPGEPDHCGIVGGSSYWFMYEPSVTGQMRLNTDGSSYNTILAVYRDTFSGSGYESLEPVTCDNNSGLDGLDSAVSFTAYAGEVYYIVIDGVNGATGYVAFNYSFNTAPTISTISNQTINEDNSTSAISFSISDAQTSAGSLTVSASSSNSTLTPSSSFSFGGSGGSRTLTITPAANKNGTATITVTVTDAGGMQATRSFTLTVNAVNDAPVAVSDYGYRYPYQQIYYYIPSLLANDYDVDGHTVSLVAVSYWTAQGGTVSVSGSYVTYTPPLGYIGTDSFTYTASDGHGLTATGTVYAYMY